MKPLPEEPRFPVLKAILTALVSLIPSAAPVYLVYKFLLSTEATIQSLAYIEQIVRLISIGLAVLMLGIIIFNPLLQFIINHLSGRDQFGDNTPANSVFASAYAISSSYVLPYADHFTNKRGEHFCDLYLSFSYAEVLHVYQTLKKRHQLTHQFRTLSLPSHLGRRMPLLTRAGAEQILREMHVVADANGEAVQAQRVVLLYTFYPHYSSRADLPDHQVFISRDTIRDLLYLIDPAPDHVIPCLI